MCEITSSFSRGEQSNRLLSGFESADRFRVNSNLNMWLDIGQRVVVTDITSDLCRGAWVYVYASCQG